MKRLSAVTLVVFFSFFGPYGNAEATQPAPSPPVAREYSHPIGEPATEMSRASEPPPPVAPTPAHRVSFVISGGVSLGMYEAGLLWTFLEASRIMTAAEWEAEFPSGNTLEVSGFYGASAGGINAVLGAIQSCLVNPGSADSNLLRTAWLGVGVDDLLPLRGTSIDREKYEPGDHLLSRRAFADSIHLIEKTLADSVFFPNCRRHVVLLATRTNPNVVALGDVRIPTQRVVIPVVLETDSDGRPSWKVDTTVLDMDRGVRGAALRLRDNDGGRVKLTDVLSSMLATSAFPVAFSPIVLDHCVNVDEIGTHQQCDVSESLECPAGTRRCREEFLDGGVFDNIPLGLAAGHQAILNDRKASDPWVVYIDPDIRRGQPRMSPSMAKDAGIGRLLEVIGGVVATGRKQELEMQARRWIDAPSSTLPVSRILVSTRRAPLTASIFNNFGAFLSPSFRSHDYAVGVFDALWQLAYRQCQVHTAHSASDLSRIPKESCVSEKLAWWSPRLLADSPLVRRIVNRLAALELDSELGLSSAPWPTVIPDGGPSREELLTCAKELGPVLVVRGKGQGVSVLSNPFVGPDVVRNRFSGIGHAELEVMAALTARVSPCQESGKWQKADATMSACVQEPDFRDVVRRLACQLHVFESQALFNMALRELVGRSSSGALVPAIAQRQLQVEDDALTRARSVAQAVGPDGNSPEQSGGEQWSGRLRIAGYLLSEPNLAEFADNDIFFEIFRFYFCSGTSIPQGAGYGYCFLPSRLEFDPVRGGVRLGYDWGLRRGEASGISLGGSFFVADWRPASNADDGGFGVGITGLRVDVQASGGSWYFGPQYTLLHSGHSFGISLDFMRKAGLNLGWRFGNAPGLDLSFAVSDLSGLAYWMTR
jgi:predicted acylesterase/phospholipase RssA